MRNITIIAGLILILALAAACTGNEPAGEPDPPNVAQASPTTTQAQSATALTAEPSAIVLAPTAASETTAPTEESPVPMRLEQTRRPPAAMGNICWRTPGIQEKLIEDLRIPSCQLINESELFRIMEFDVDTPEVNPGDFEHMPNLKDLQIEELRKFPEAGTFDGLSALEKLSIRIASDGWSDWGGGPKTNELTVPKGTFAGLDALKRLEINSNEISITLESEVLKGLNQLEYIGLGGISDISADDLIGLSQVRRIKLSYRKNRGDDGEGRPIIPKDLIARLPTVESLTIEGGFQWPTALEMSTLEHACLMEDKGYIPDDTVMTVDGKIIQHQGKEHRDGRPFCILKVEDEIQEMPLPTPTP